jgi:hypothetical protein
MEENRFFELALCLCAVVIITFIACTASKERYGWCVMDKVFFAVFMTIIGIVILGHVAFYASRGWFIAAMVAWTVICVGIHRLIYYCRCGR